MALQIGICSLDLHLRGMGSLKEKRRVMRSLVTRIRNKFNVSIAEIDYQDYWQRSYLGVACVSNERQYLHQVLQQVVNYIDKFPEVELGDYQIEII